MATSREIYDQYKETHRWPRGLKKDLLERDGNGCVLCGSQQQVSIHHIIESRKERKDKGLKRRQNYVDTEKSRKAGRIVGKYELNGLILLCGSCHGKVHRAKDDTPFMKLFYKIVEEKRQGSSDKSTLEDPNG